MGEADLRKPHRERERERFHEDNEPASERKRFTPRKTKIEMESLRRSVPLNETLDERVSRPRLQNRFSRVSAQQR